MVFYVTYACREVVVSNCHIKLFTNTGKILWEIKLEQISMGKMAPLTIIVSRIVAAKIKQFDASLVKQGC